MFEYINKADSLIMGSVKYVLKQWWLRKIGDYNIGWTAENLDFNGWFCNYIFTISGAQNALVAHQIVQSDESWRWIALAYSDIDVKRTWMTGFIFHYMFMSWCFMYLLKSTVLYVRTPHLCVSCGFYSISSFFFISGFRRVLNIVYVLLDISPASVWGLPTFRNPLSVPSSKAGCRIWSVNSERELGVYIPVLRFPLGWETNGFR